MNDIGQLSQAEVIANVERMLQNEKQSIKSLPKAQANQEFDMNEGIVSVAKGPTKPGAKAEKGSSRATTAETSSSSLDASGAKREQTMKAVPEQDEEDVLEQDIQLIRRKTLAVRTDNVSEAFMQNIDSIAETVQGFQKMSEESF